MIITTNMSGKSNILSAFNDHFTDFVNDIISVFPNDPDLLAAKNAFTLIRKVNPKMVIQIWDKYVVGKYKAQIEDGNIDFFITKNYNEDLSNTENSDKIMSAINRLRNPVKMMSVENQKKTMKYIQNLTNLSSMYMI
jgi:hypothetical protein